MSEREDKTIPFIRYPRPIRLKSMNEIISKKRKRRQQEREALRQKIDQILQQLKINNRNL